MRGLYSIWFTLPQHKERMLAFFQMSRAHVAAARTTLPPNGPATEHDPMELDLDDQIADLKIAMEKACEHDNRARQEGLPATRKLQLLPEETLLFVQDAVGLYEGYVPRACLPARFHLLTTTS